MTKFTTTMAALLIVGTACTPFGVQSISMTDGPTISAQSDTVAITEAQAEEAVEVDEGNASEELGTEQTTTEEEDFGAVYEDPSTEDLGPIEILDGCDGANEFSDECDIDSVEFSNGDASEELGVEQDQPEDSEEYQMVIEDPATEDLGNVEEEDCVISEEFDGCEEDYISVTSN